MRPLLVSLLALLGACRTPPAPVQPAAPAATAVPGSALYSVDAVVSQVLLQVYREGPMVALGHNHIIAVRALQGSVQLHEQAERSRFELQFPVAALSVDEPALRAQAGADFSSAVSEGTREGTRNNMLGEKLLQSARNANIRLKSERIASNASGGWTVTTRISVRGQETLIDIPLQLLKEADSLTASGEFAVLQTALGLTPYSVMFGALRVADEIKVHFTIVARRVQL